MDPTQNGYTVSQDMSQADLPAPASPQFDGTAVANEIAQPLTVAQAGLPQIDPGQVSAQTSVGAGIVTSSQTNAPTIADDVDLIEKEWVIKAKDIVARTRDDPNLQSKEMNKFKADYLKTRFSKDLKVSE